MWRKQNTRKQLYISSKKERIKVVCFFFFFLKYFSCEVEILPSEIMILFFFLCRVYIINLKAYYRTFGSKFYLLMRVMLLAREKKVEWVGNEKKNTIIFPLELFTSDLTLTQWIMFLIFMKIFSSVFFFFFLQVKFLFR